MISLVGEKTLILLVGEKNNLRFHWLGSVAFTGKSGVLTSIKHLFCQPEDKFIKLSSYLPPTMYRGSI